MAEPNTQQKRPEWQKIKVLGKGSFGEVSVWREVTTQQLIAVKECIRLLNTDADCRKEKHVEYWNTEVETMYKLKHPNIVQAVVLPPELLAKLNTQLTPFGMEYINGGSLRALMERPENWWLPEQKVRHILHDMCSGLQYLHRKHHIVHRDIKPENIVIQLTGSDRNVYKIIDLGYIKELNPDSVTASLVGTMAYIAPEIFQPTRKYNYLVDYWSLGIVTFEITTGIRPFAAVSWQEITQHAPELMKRNDGIIYAVRTPQGIEYSRELPERPLQKRFREELTRWLRTVLSFNPEQRKGEPRNSLDEMLAMLNRKVVQVLDTTTQKIVVLPESSVPEDLHTATMILPSNQLLISSEGKEIPFTQLMERVAPHVESDKLSAYVFSFSNSYILSPNRLPKDVTQKLATRGSELRQKRLWQEMYHHVDGEYTNCCNILAAYRTLILYVNSLHSEFNAKLNVLSASYKEVKISAKILKDNQDYDRIQMSKYAHSALEDLREVRTADVVQNVAAIKANMTTVVAKAHTLHTQLAKLRENPYSCSKPPTNLESLRNEVLITLKKFNATRPTEDMITAMQNFKEEHERLLSEISAQMRAALNHVKDIRAAVAQCQTFAAEVAREQTKLHVMQQERRIAVWNVIKKLMVSEPQHESMEATMDSLTRKPNVGIIVQDNKDHRTQLDSLNSLMELELSGLNENIPSFASFM